MQKEVNRREIRDGWERKMEKEERETETEAARQTLPWEEAVLWSCAQGAVWAFPGQRPLAPSPGPQRTM